MSAAKPGSRLVGVKELREMYGIGRATASRLIRTLPHVQLGRRRLVFLSDVEEFFKRAVESGLNLTEYIRRNLGNEDEDDHQTSE